MTNQSLNTLFESQNQDIFIKLFKGFLAPDLERQSSQQRLLSAFESDNQTDTRRQIERAAHAGINLPGELFALAPERVAQIIDSAINYYGVSAESINSTFYSNWDKIKEMSPLEMLIHQLVHYASAYGQVSDFQNSGEIYVPDPNYVEDMEFSKQVAKTFAQIKAFSHDEITEKVNHLLASGIALDTDDVVALATAIKAYDVEIDMLNVKNKEMACFLIDEFQFAPASVNQFFRQIVYLASDHTNTLLVQNPETLQLIKAHVKSEHKTHGQKSPINLLFCKLVNEIGLEYIAQEFNRHKGYFMALRADASLRPTINHISRLSKTMHKPMPQDPLANIVALSPEYSDQKLLELASKRNLFQVIRAINALRLLLLRDSQSEITTAYNIRNGKTWIAQDKPVKHLKPNEYEMHARRESLLLNHVIETVHANLKKHQQDEITKASKTSSSKTQDAESKLAVLQDQLTRAFNTQIVILPESLNYALPTSMKSFVGTLPLYTSISVQGPTLVGITWDFYADIDLNATGPEAYITFYNQTGIKGATHSGDMTDLNRHGFASEVIEIGQEYDKSLVFSDSLYDGADGKDYKLFVGPKPGHYLKSNVEDANKPMVDILDVDLVTSLTTNSHSKTFALSVPTRKNGVSVGHKVFLIKDKLNEGPMANMTVQQALINDTEYKAMTAVSLNEILEQQENVVIVHSQDQADALVTQTKKAMRDYLYKMSLNTWHGKTIFESDAVTDVDRLVDATDQLLDDIDFDNFIHVSDFRSENVTIQSFTDLLA